MKNILVPVDFSDITSDVVKEADLLAHKFSAKLWLIHIIAPNYDTHAHGYKSYPKLMRNQLAGHFRDEHRKLQKLAEGLRKSEDDTTAMLIQGETVETILKEASKVSADLIVLGSHGNGALHKALLGSVSEGVLRKSPCPVLIMPPSKKI